MCRHTLAAAVLASVLPLPAAGAERDICENKAGPDLIRCIEAAARDGSQGSAQDAAKASAPAARPGATAPPQAPAAAAAPAEDCTGRSGQALRHCLAAGGRLAPEAAIAVPAAAPAPPVPAARSESCDGKSGEALRHCVEVQARATEAPRSSQPQIVACGGYTPADQQLCLHRNNAIMECRKRGLYPDFDVCLRSHMVRVPEPQRADCSKLQSRSRAHCEARNRVYAACSGDKLGYFACLERQLGADAVLTRR